MSIVIVDPKNAKFFVNGEEIKLIEENELCECGQESYYAGHGFRNGELYSEYHCKECYNKRKS